VEDVLDTEAAARPTFADVELRALFAGVRTSWLGWMQILDVSDPWNIGLQFRTDYDLATEFTTEGTWGDRLDLPSVVIASVDDLLWVYDTAPETRGRIVAYIRGDCWNQKAFETSRSLIDMMRCIADLAEMRAFVGGTAESHAILPEVTCEDYN
jgi:hypothetical protein